MRPGGKIKLPVSETSSAAATSSAGGKATAIVRQKKTVSLSDYYYLR